MTGPIRISLVNDPRLIDDTWKLAQRLRQVRAAKAQDMAPDTATPSQSARKPVAKASTPTPVRQRPKRSAPTPQTKRVCWRDLAESRRDLAIDCVRAAAAWEIHLAELVRGGLSRRDAVAKLARDRPSIHAGFLAHHNGAGRGGDQVATVRHFTGLDR